MSGTSTAIHALDKLSPRLGDALNRHALARHRWQLGRTEPAALPKQRALDPDLRDRAKWRQLTDSYIYPCAVCRQYHEYHPLRAIKCKLHGWVLTIQNALIEPDPDRDDAR